MVEQCVWGMSIQNQVFAISIFSGESLPVRRGVYSLADCLNVSPWYILDGKFDRLMKSARKTSWPKKNSAISVFVSLAAVKRSPRLPLTTSSLTRLSASEIYYADLNLLVEAWHRVRTDAAGKEAIIDQAKD